MIDELSRFLGVNGYIPHGYCLTWSGPLVFTYVVSDILIFLSYFSMPVALVYFARYRKDFPYQWLLWMFAAFILLCGATHLMDAIVLWLPLYGLDAMLKAATALISVFTAYMLWPLIPHALKLPSSDQLRQLNEALEREIVERKRIEDALRWAKIAAEESLLDERIHMAAIVESSEEAIIGKSIDGLITSWNRSAEKIFGYPAAEIIGQSDNFLVPPEYYQEEVSILERILRGESVKAFNTVRVCKDGRRIDVSISISPIRNREGRIIGAAIIARDISERKQAEIQLKLWAESFEHAHFGLAISDAKTNTFKAVNPAFASQRGFSQDELIDKPVLSIFPPDFSDEARAKIAALDVTNHGVFESRHLRKNGESFPVMLDITVIKSPDGKPINRIAYALDITERRAMEQLVRDQEQRHRFALDTIGVGEWEFNLTTATTVHCLLHDRIFGYDSLLSEWSYELFMTHVLPEDRERVDGSFHQAVQENAVWDFDCRIRRIDGHVRWIHARGQPRTNDAGDALFTGIVMDITERKWAEEEIRRLNTGLESRIKERTAELTAANRELDSFAYAVSHDLRAPLRAMSGFSQALVEDYGKCLPGEALGYLDQIGFASRKMNELIDGLLALSRITRGPLQLDVLDITALSKQLLAELAQSEPGLKVTAQLEAGIQARGDIRMIELVLRNLLGNAWKYTAKAEAPGIRVYTEEQDGMRRFCVADNGAGFDMAHAGKLFEPFQRLHRQDEFPGIGIGLATVQRIIHRHGGVIEAKGEPGKGAVFCFTLPGMSTDLET